MVTGSGKNEEGNIHFVGISNIVEVSVVIPVGVLKNVKCGVRDIGLVLGSPKYFQAKNSNRTGLVQYGVW